MDHQFKNSFFLILKWVQMYIYINPRSIFLFDFLSSFVFNLYHGTTRSLGNNHRHGSCPTSSIAVHRVQPPHHYLSCALNELHHLVRVYSTKEHAHIFSLARFSSQRR
jgi:hypothetical protein